MLEPGRQLDEWLAAAMQPTADPAWVLHEHGYTPLREAGIESRFAIANGFLGVRGSRAISRGPMWMSFLHTLSWASWPRTFVAGLFDTPNTEPPVPALVPAPDWVRVRLLLEGEPLMLRSGRLLAHARTLDMRRGILLTEWVQCDPKNRVVRVRALRLVSFDDRAIAMQVVEVAVENEPADVTLEAALEVTNSGLEEVRETPDVVVWQTANSDKWLSMASGGEVVVDGARLVPDADTQLRRTWSWRATPGQTASFRRIVAVVRSDAASPDVDGRARDALARAFRTGCPGLLEAHTRAWADRWDASDILVEGDAEAQQALRFATYHLNAAANPADEHVSIGARALTGDAYLGHVFWDTEIYLLPFYVFTWPEAARALLMYRWHTLPGARDKARRLGYRGALYAWESADTGEETTPEQIIDPDGRLIDVLCGTLEQHISADVAYAVWQYWQATGDDAFFADAGAEILLETARFWASRATADDDGSCHIRDVIGPDEYHEHVDDNAFTNGMARWNLARGLDAVAWLRARRPDRWATLAGALALDDDELAQWASVAQRLVLLVKPGTQLLEQFAGYFDLEDIDLSAYTGRTAPMDVILGRERTQRSQVVKQADVVALLVLQPELLPPAARLENLRYYEPRCGHGSSLSRSMHAVVAARLGDVAMAECYSRDTAATDLADTRGGSAGGVRIAALGGLWHATMFGFAGLSLHADGLGFAPHLPSSWRALQFRVQWRGRRLLVRCDGVTRQMTVTLEAGEPMQLHVGARAHALSGDAPLRVSWDAGGDVAWPEATPPPG